ncbi:hypothetical protein [Plastoroseomonas hellenica]|uniref:hypothetical protein n=1 Tax=Plastoroseomonas hellenica TaxID=2687306 RepID=UPI001BA57531|nr:hypothetical protein [Plastoroseomonas hellenica]MBR0647815.1 hypothetical protein [Plastoroseomonas hellenica]
MRKSLAAFAFVALVAGSALAQSDPAGSLPPPVKSLPQTQEASFGERVGATADRAASGVGRAARATGGAVKRAARWTGNRLERAGEWTRDRAERIGR